ncbi:MAG TPA: hypothetical protein VGO47_07815 [Chlamydiales bacterium]|jgi:hypothetical protein|nr:hypothetical protein [Chlamydiales bacterium]
MKKQVIALVVISLMIVGCANPKKDRIDVPKREQKEGCGCQSSENILDLRGTTENSNNGLANPTVTF